MLLFAYVTPGGDTVPEEEGDVAGDVELCECDEELREIVLVDEVLGFDRVVVPDTGKCAAWASE